MSREIKFRAWDKITKQIFKVKEIDFDAIERNIYGLIIYKSILGGVNESLSFRSFDNVELMQYTGLKDKHGVEIYEGDIVKFKGLFDIGKYENVEIVFDKGEFCIKWRGSICHNLLASNSDSIEVIGNIHQNKDLLK